MTCCMAKIEVKLEADYGCSCSGHGYGSNNIIELEVSDKVLEALRTIDDKEVTREEVVEAIDGGEEALQDLHDKIDSECFDMVEEYWLFEAYNECLEESLQGCIEDDIEEGRYTPMSFEDFVEGARNKSIDFEDLQFGYYDDIDDMLDDEEEMEDLYQSFILNGYYDWVCELSHWEAAERVGLDLDACHDENTIDYTIVLKN